MVRKYGDSLKAEQRRSIIRASQYVLEADAKIAPQENWFLTKVSLAFGITEDEIEKIRVTIRETVGVRVGIGWVVDVGPNEVDGVGDSVAVAVIEHDGEVEFDRVDPVSLVGALIALDKDRAERRHARREIHDRGSHDAI